MAQVLNGNQVKLNSGQIIQAQQGGWYDGQQFWGGTLSNPGQINPQSNQQGAGQAVSQEVIAQTNPENVAYVNAQRQQVGLPPAPTVAAPPPSAPTPRASTPSASTASGAGLGITSPEVINLPQLYESLYASSGIRDIESDLTSKTMAYNEQVAKIKDNPYLSEATMTGRLKKLEEKFNADTQAVRNDIAMRKADIETQLNLQTKQFDINSQAAKQALDQFNTLLGSGALDNASGEDIANLTRTTGISSSMIQSAIDVSRKAKEKAPDTQLISYDDGTNQGFAVVNTETGEIINSQIIAGSKPTKSSGGNTKIQELQETQSNAVADAKSGVTLQSLINRYVIPGGLSTEEIYQIYNSNSPRGAAKESLNQVKQGIFATQKGFKTEAQQKAESKKRDI